MLTTASKSPTIHILKHIATSFNQRQHNVCLHLFTRILCKKLIDATIVPDLAFVRFTLYFFNNMQRIQSSISMLGFFFIGCQFGKARCSKIKTNTKSILVHRQTNHLKLVFYI